MKNINTEIKITDKDRAENLVFQVKQLLINLNTITKPQIEQALNLLSIGSENLPIAAINEAFSDQKEQIVKKLTQIKTVL